MTARDYTGDEDAASGTSVRTAWDAVKSDVTSLALSVGTIGLVVACSVMEAASGNSFQAVGFGVWAALYGVVPAIRVGTVVRKLKNIPAPKP